MDEHVAKALERDRTIDITTVGRTSGRPHRIETWIYRVDGQAYLTGSPGVRGWYANLQANPVFTVHLKESASADLSARATPITDANERRAILARILRDLGHPEDLESWVASSPLAAVDFDVIDGVNE